MPGLVAPGAVSVRCFTQALSYSQAAVRRVPHDSSDDATTIMSEAVADTGQPVGAAGSSGQAVQGSNPAEQQQHQAPSTNQLAEPQPGCLLSICLASAYECQLLSATSLELLGFLVTTAAAPAASMVPPEALAAVLDSSQNGGLTVQSAALNALAVLLPEMPLLSLHEAVDAVVAALQQYGAGSIPVQCPGLPAWQERALTCLHVMAGISISQAKSAQWHATGPGGRAAGALVDQQAAGMSAAAAAGGAAGQDQQAPAVLRLAAALPAAAAAAADGSCFQRQLLELHAMLLAAEPGLADTAESVLGLLGLPGGAGRVVARCLTPMMHRVPQEAPQVSRASC